MAQLAFMGHPTRGSEVIALLEMLGGNNANNCYGKYCDRVYYINKNGYINQDFISHIEQDTKFFLFTLEEFEEKFPYKVGDKVIYNNEVYIITKMVWQCDYICYKLNDKLYTNEMDKLKPHITAEELINEAVYAELDKPKEFHDTIAFTIPYGYEFGYIDIDNSQVVLKKKKPKYPKTYKECCKELGITDIENGYCGYKWELLGKFQELLICRDAYWKIAGAEMGLGKPWKPTLHHKETHYAISNVCGKVKYERYGEYNAILAFPTMEMRSAFYENFKDLIEQCKELL